MHFRVPKPLHGWREFCGEIGVIVIGVLIALILEAAVTEYTWHRKVEAAEQELRYEVGYNLALLHFMDSLSTCASARLDEIASLLQHATKTGRLAPVGNLSGVGRATFPDGVWQSQVAAETATHMPTSELAALSRIYRTVEQARDSADKGADAWLTLDSISGPGRPVDPSTIQRLEEARMIAASAQRSNHGYETFIRKILGESKLGANFAQLDPTNPPILPNAMNSPLCQPLDLKPART